ncbi:MAG TPA: ABC transporter permease [Candidatus Acidoferrales bacterium]|nr:ABC transporter permease [Candidatus Acidoferrales bacterium]
MKLFRDVRLLYTDSMRHSFKNPVFIFLSLFQPLMFMLLYMPLLGGLGGVPGFSSGTVNVFIPGLLVMQAIFEGGFVGFSLIDDIRSGVISRLLVTPVSRSAILLGKILRDTTIILMQCLLITGVALPFGLNLNPAGFLLSLVLYALMGIIMSSLSYGFALIYKAEDSLAPTMNTITLPLSLLAGIFLPLALAPVWLQTLGKVNPFAYGVDATRELFAGNFLSFDIFAGFILLGVLSVVVFYWALHLLYKMAK